MKILLNEISVGDARALAEKIPANFINVTITSPPYFDLKDYGSENQIGYGQSYSSYLNDLKKIFKEIHRATVNDGSLWIIVDTFRKDQEVYALPFDLAASLREIEWVLRDIIIWKKERTLPWTHSGTTRKIFEYILVFSKKGQSFKYDPDKYRDTTNLKKWWVKYPERYNPKGKSLEEIWSYDIPTQGSWGNEYIRHFCPLPSELVARIIQMTTPPGGVVFDPFSGSGTVPTVSQQLGRNYSGIELNKDYVTLFEEHIKKEKSKNPNKENAKNLNKTAHDFETIIKKLRILKYGRLIYRDIIKTHDVRIFCFESKRKTQGKHALYSATYLILHRKKSNHKKILDHIISLSAKPPLSKFGIEPSFIIATNLADTQDVPTSPVFYSYTYSNSHYCQSSVKLETGWEGTYKIFSPIKLNVEEPDD